jgi:hypothetical protein
MIQLKVPWPSLMDNNLSDYVRSYAADDWVSKVKLLPGVKDAEWVSASRSSVDSSHTLITFESEADKTWFILRWS